MTPDDERWVKALAIKRTHGVMVPAYIAERIGALAMAGDLAGVTRFREIAARYEQLPTGRRQACGAWSGAIVGRSKVRTHGPRSCALRGPPELTAALPRQHSPSSRGDRPSTAAPGAGWRQPPRVARS